MNAKRAVLALLLATALPACTNAPTRSEAPPETTKSAAHENLNAVLWMQTAAEYEASVRGTYAAARDRLDAALADPAWSALPEHERADGFEAREPAIIVDADETMIDNSPFQARGVRDGGGFQYERWLAWVNERRARALPGAREFADYATQKGVTIFFITNRDAPAETESTIANLRALGFPIAADASNVMLRGDERASMREKSGRRRWVGSRYRVLLLLGDNLGDFMDGVATSVPARAALMEPYASWWGERWFMLPNPSYGSWEASVLSQCTSEQPLDELSCKKNQMRFD